MSILVNKSSKILISGMTGKEGTFHSRKMIEMGTNVVCGVTPGKAGAKHLGVPIYDSVDQALECHRIDACGIFVPADHVYRAVIDAVESGIKLVVVITEGICPHVAVRFISYARDKGVTVLGPNTPGILTPQECKIGVLATEYIKKGKVGVISRSGTLTVEICYYMLQEGFGQSTVIGLGGDPAVGSTFRDVYKLFEKDAQTQAVVIVGEIGGTMEEELAEYIKKSENKKPAVAFIAGRNAPRGKRLGHAGAIIQGSIGTTESKIAALEDAGVRVARVPWNVPELIREMI
ncbi:succinate--CoA ligase subunit alpha [Elusimicrobiota bacterium]